ncbi:MAG: XRE family transcriptional regulator [Gemmatimonadaceae bacterium]|nr:XRE family transcriptional regulator [Gemmatimonadaceae bacterium]
MLSSLVRATPLCVVNGRRNRSWLFACNGRLGVTQPRVSDLVRGRIELFSIDTLVAMLTRLDVAVTVKTKRRRRVA